MNGLVTLWRKARAVIVMFRIFWMGRRIGASVNRRSPWHPIEMCRTLWILPQFFLLAFRSLPVFGEFRR